MNKSKAKGTAWETAVVEYLKNKGINCERRALNGADDRGDIVIFDRPSLVLECKSEKAFNLSSYMAETAAEVFNAGGDFGVTILKAPRKSVGKAYVILEFDSFIDDVLIDMVMPRSRKKK